MYFSKSNAYPTVIRIEMLLKIFNAYCTSCLNLHILGSRMHTFTKSRSWSVGHRVCYKPVVYLSRLKDLNQILSGPFGNIIFVYYERHRLFECQEISKDTIGGLGNLVRKTNGMV